MYVVLIGAPGSGKGTQAKALAEDSGLTHVASGDLFRDVVEKGGPLGWEVEGYLKRGELVPDDLTVAMVMERIQDPDMSRGIILDGFPRTVQQAQALDQALAARGQRIDRAIYLKVPTDVLLGRLSGRWICRSCQASFHELFRPPRVESRCDYCGGELYQRPDDRRETAEHRLQVYFESTEPVIDYYRERSVLVEVNGDRSVEMVGADLARQLKQVAL